MSRIEKAKSVLNEKKVDFFLIERPVDLFYFTGKNLSAGLIFIGKDEVFLFADGRYYNQCKDLSGFTLLPYEEKEIEAFLKDTIQDQKIGFDGDTLSYARFDKWAELCQKQGGAKLASLYQLGQTLRMVKEDQELDKMRKAAEICSLGYDFLLSQLTTGITEEELVKRLELYFLEKGGKFSFDPIIAFGPSSANPHYTPGPIPLKEGDIVLMDLGFEYDHYQSDMTRTVFWKQAPAELETIYHIVEQAQKQALESVRSGILAKELDAIARSYITENGYGEEFCHNLGHGIGLEVHEFPSLSPKSKEAHTLEENMVITVEPGIYLPGVGGVRIENSVVVGELGFEDLTKRSTELQILV